MTSPFYSSNPSIPGLPAPFSQNIGTPQAFPRPLKNDERTPDQRVELDPRLRWPAQPSEGRSLVGSIPTSMPFQSQLDTDLRSGPSPEHHLWDQDSATSRDSLDLIGEAPSSRGSAGTTKSQGKGHSQRRPSNRDEFDGPHQFLDKPSPATIAAQEQELPHVNDRLSQCAFDFIAKYQFPIPLEPDKRPVRIPQDREWTEWVYLLKRLATKRRIPARVLYNGQIKQLVTVLENSLEMRHAAKHQSRPLKDDRNVLQLVSAGLQVAKILKDASTMEFLDYLYVRTEALINSRKSKPAYMK